MPVKRLKASEDNKLAAAANVAQEIAAMFNDDDANKLANSIQELRGKYADKPETVAK